MSVFFPSVCVVVNLFHCITTGGGEGQLRDACRTVYGCGCVARITVHTSLQHVVPCVCVSLSLDLAGLFHPLLSIKLPDTNVASMLLGCHGNIWLLGVTAPIHRVTETSHGLCLPATGSVSGGEKSSGRALLRRLQDTVV